MRNLKRILFTLTLAFVGVFAMGNASALAGVPLYKTSEVGITTGADKVNITVVPESSLGEVKSQLETASTKYYPNGSYVQMVPLKFDITGTIDDSIVYYVKVPEEWFPIFTYMGAINYDNALNNTKIARLYYEPTVLQSTNEPAGWEFNPILCRAAAGDDACRLDYVAGKNDIEFVKGTLSGNTFTEDANGAYYAKVTADLKDVRGLVPAQGDTVYYVLAICYTNDNTPTQPSPTTTTTTAENPKTLDGNNSLYIVLGVIGLMGIVGLGTKFAKSSK